MVPPRLFKPWFLIDTVGRRKLLLVTITLMAICSALEAGLLSAVKKGTKTKATGGAATAFLFCYLGLFTVSTLFLFVFIRWS